jgi:ribonuclease III
VSYSVVNVEGPPHDRHFTCAASIDGEQVGLGTGRSKKAAEQEAARQALEGLGVQGETVQLG